MDSKISDLTLASSLTGDDVLPIVNGGSTKKVKISQLNIPSIVGLATTTYVDTQDALKVDKITGKGLSTEDYTTTEKNKLAGIQANAEVNVNADWNATSGDAQILNKPSIPSIDGLATTTYVDNQDALKVDKVVGSRLITSAESTLLGNTSGTNSGDNATNNQYSGLATSKQDTLQSTVNIKSINGNSLLGSGDLVISGGGASPQSQYTVLANNTASSAVPTEQGFRNEITKAYTGAIPTWTGTTAPSGATTHTYRWTRIGNQVSITISLVFATSGSGLTGVIMTLPSDAPSPLEPTGLTSASNPIYVSTWGASQTLTSGTLGNAPRSLMRNNSSNNGFEFVSNFTGSTIITCFIHCQYTAQ